MTHTPPTYPSFGQILGEVMDLTVGLGIGLLPLLLLAVPGIIVFVVLPALVLLALALPFVLLGALLGLPPYLVRRALQ
jgi:hypothetical protein